MATGRVGASDLSATTWTTVYTVPAATTFTGSISVCNRTAGQVTVRLGLGTGSSPSAGEYIEYDLPLTPAGTPGSSFERSGVVLETGMKVLAYSSAASVSVVVYGYEE